ncbi:MAG: UDP-N-acetylmuramate dehydrogenase [Magnetococcales bacterium]|nr:UDP-N-acetylmuramate dehydrogenase [Magnetococcales bacterium]
MPTFPPLARPVVEGAILAARTTWRVGGPARWLVTPTSIDELIALGHRLTATTPRLLLGGGSNVLIDDAGFDGVVIDLKSGLRRLRLLDDQTIEAEAGVTMSALAHFARRQGLAGAEFLAGIPGSIGGALRMNAGAYGSAMRTLLLDAQVLDPTGVIHTQTPEMLRMAYRHTALPPGWIFLSGRFRLQPGDPEAIRRTMRDLHRRRAASQPLDYPSAGSVFRNPPGGGTAWRLIDEAGLRGAWEGGAQVAEKHCNFILNRGGARSRDLLALIERVREKVFKMSGIELENEVLVIPAKG